MMYVPACCCCCCCCDSIVLGWLAGSVYRQAPVIVYMFSIAEENNKTGYISRESAETIYIYRERETGRKMKIAVCIYTYIYICKSYSLMQ